MKISKYSWRNSLNLILNTRPFFAKKRKKWENPKGTKQNEQKFIT